MEEEPVTTDDDAEDDRSRYERLYADLEQVVQSGAVDDWDRYPELDMLLITANPEQSDELEAMLRDAMAHLQAEQEWDRAPEMARRHPKIAKVQAWVPRTER